MWYIINIFNFILIGWKLVLIHMINESSLVCLLAVGSSRRGIAHSVGQDNPFSLSKSREPLSLTDPNWPQDNPYTDPKKTIYNIART